jgi:Rps23 Pro-64 3,4-dihydroxylase Tpa1-like proline 4-hydroxylase
LSEPKAFGPMPPHGTFDGLLDDDELAALLDWAIGAQGEFKPAKVFYGEGGMQRKLDPTRRNALKHNGAGPLEPVLRERLFGKLPAIMAAAGYRGPEPRSIEFELNAYGEGAHFVPHIDIPLGQVRKPAGDQPDEDRVITMVYYFHSEPKAFSGGALRLYRFGADPETAGADDSIAFEPLQNSLVVFPSWAMHAVEAVRCPSGRFADYRFGLNCWLCRPIGA